MKVKIKKIHPDAVIPEYAHGPAEDAGLDLRAIERVELFAHKPVLVKTGLSIELPPGFEAQIRSRSGLSLKQSLVVMNSPATIDPGYRGEIGVILCWQPPMVVKAERFQGAIWDVTYRPDRVYDHIIIGKGDRIAQLVVAKYEPIEWEEAELADSERGSSGFGSTGVK